MRFMKQQFASSQFSLLLAFPLALACACASNEDPSGSDGQDNESSSSGSGANASSGGGGAGGDEQAGGSANSFCGAAPCGGDVVGAFRYSQACGEAPWLEEACGNASMKRSRYVYRIEGTAVFSAAGSVQIDRQVFAGWEIQLPKDCMVPGATCDSVVQGDNVSCIDRGDLCNCSSVVAGPLESAVEPYELSGTTLLVGAGAEQAALEYCVTADGMSALHAETGEQTFFERE